MDVSTTGTATLLARCRLGKLGWIGLSLSGCPSGWFKGRSLTKEKLFLGISSDHAIDHMFEFILSRVSWFLTLVQRAACMSFVSTYVGHSTAIRDPES